MTEWHRELRLAEKRVNFAAIDAALTQGVEKLKAAGAPATRAIALAVKDGKSTKRLQKRLAAALAPVLVSLRKFGAEQVYREAKQARHGEPPALPEGGTDIVAAAMAEKIAGRIQYSFDNFDEELDPEAVDAALADAADSALGIVARYSVTTPLNEGRDQAATALADQISSAQYSALLDAATCDACDAKDGEEYEIGTSEYDDAEVPNPDCAGGSNCRCVLVYVFADEG